MATTYYLAPTPTGNDANAGTEASPWELPSFAHSNSIVGDTIIFLDGTYDFDTMGDLLGGRTWKVKNLHEAIFLGDAGNPSKNLGSNTENTIIDGIRFKDVIPNASGSNGYAFGVVASLDLGFLITIKNCWFDNIGPDIRFVQSGTVNGRDSIDCLFQSCIFKDIIFPSNRNFLRVDTETDTVSQKWRFYNCIFSNVASWNGLIRHETSSLARAFIEIKNSILTFPTLEITLGDTNETTINYTFSNNCFHDLSGGITSNTPNTNGITSDPLIIDLDNGEFHLRPDSPCLDAGVIL